MAELREAGASLTRETLPADMRIESKTELAIASDVARRLGISKQRVAILLGGAGFPEPIGTLGRSQVWRWSSVEYPRSPTHSRRTLILTTAAIGLTGIIVYASARKTRRRCDGVRH